MKIIQVTRTVNDETFEPIALITLELPISDIEDYFDSDDETIERVIGREYLKAMFGFLEEQKKIDAEEKKEEHVIA
jgi:hypothetical protein